MTNTTELWVNRDQLRETKIVTGSPPQLNDGEVLVAMDKFGLTANNVSYALTGDMIGYWNYYPAEAPWGKVTVWGCADVVESNDSDIPIGERLWGFFPMASHVVLRPGKIRKDGFTDISEHRKALPALYNQYNRTKAEPAFMTELENERCLLFPLFATSFFLADYLLVNDFFGAEQVLIGSSSSKTGFGLAKMLADNPEVKQKLVGLTSQRNAAFVESLKCCDSVITYGSETAIDAGLKSAYIDMSGDVRLTTALHQHIGDNVVESAMVGASHWEDGGKIGKLPGAKPTFFFAPGHIAMREKEWGAGVPWQKAMAASAEVARTMEGTMDVEWSHGAEAVNDVWQRLLDNKVAPSTGIMASLLQPAGQ